MRTVDLDGLEAGRQRPPGAITKRLDHAGNLVQGQRVRRLPAVVEGDRRRRDRRYRPATLLPAVSLAARVADLDGHRRALLAAEFHESRHRLDVAVVPDAQVALVHIVDPATLRDGVDLDDDEPHPADRAGAVVDEMPVVGRAVGVGRPHAHRRHDNAVLEGQTANLIGVE